MDDEDLKMHKEKQLELREHEEIDSLKKLPKLKLSYNSDKTGWVEFLNGKKKIKLRVHISNLAKQLSKYNKHKFNDNRNELIKVYENYGLNGLKEYILEARRMYLESENNKIQEQINALKDFDESVKGTTNSVNKFNKEVENEN